AAIITSIPRASALLANSLASLGVRCADITRDSWATPNFSSVSDAARIVSQSDLLPMRTATRDFDLVFGVRVFGINKLIRDVESVPGADRGPRAGNPRGVVDATGSHSQ